MNKLKKYLPATVWSALIFVLCFLPGNDLPESPWLNHVYFDKIVHGWLYFIFFILIFRVSGKHGFARMAIPFFICEVQGILIEYVQGSSLVQNRNSDMLDIIANTTGALLAAMLMWWFVVKRINKTA